MRNIPASLNIRGRLLEFSTPKVMGIVNVTPDSFYSPSRTPDLTEMMERVGSMVRDGVDILDIGGCSTRPGSSPVSEKEEWGRLRVAIRVIRECYPEIPISVDTFRAGVAARSVEAGADIINDIGEGDLDKDMFGTVASLGVPYVLTHSHELPADSAAVPDGDYVTAEVLRDLSFKLDRLYDAGVADVIVDPGFGFAKDTDRNFILLDRLAEFKALGCPVLAGLSRKTMIWKTLGVTPTESLNGTTALNMVALLNGASILRVHDVREAVETVKLFKALKKY